MLEFEYTGWPVLSDATLTALSSYLLDLIHLVEETFVEEEEGNGGGGGGGEGGGGHISLGKLIPGAPAEALDCAFAALDVLEGMMEARFIQCIGPSSHPPTHPLLVPCGP